MSFLTDLFSGNFGNLGTDLTHAPSSLAAHPDQLAETIGGAALLGGGILGLGALGTDAAAFGTDAAITSSELAPGVSVGFDAAGNAIGDTAALGTDIAAGGFDIAGPGIGTDVLSDPNVLQFAGGGTDFAGGVLPDTSTLATGTIDQSVTGDPFASDSFGAGAQDLTSSGTDPFTGQTATSTATTPPPSGGADIASGGDLPANATVSDTPQSGQGIPSFPGSGTGAATGGATSTLGSVMSSPWTKLALGAAPLALTLARGEPGLTSAGQQAQANANQLSQFGSQQLAQAQAGQLNPGQLASLNAMRQDLTNQWRQQFFNMGVTDPSKDTRFAQAMADVDQKVTAQTAVFIQQMIQNGLAASGSASQTLIAVANQQMAQDQAFTNNLISATKALGTTIGGGNTITLKAA